MLRTLVRAALAATVLGSFAACAKKAPDTAPKTEIPGLSQEELAAKAAKQAQEAAYRKCLDDGTQALADGNADAAAAHFRQALSEKADGAEAHFQLGRIALAKRDDAEALKEFSEAVRINPEHADAYFERAALHERAGRLKDASYDYRKIIALEVNPKTTARAYWLRSDIVDRLGNRGDYRFDRNKALTLDPSYQARVTSGDLCVFNHTDERLKIVFDQFVNADGTVRKFPPGYMFTVLDDHLNQFLSDEKDKQLVARSVRYTVTSNHGSRSYTQTYEKGVTFEIHIWQADLPGRNGK
jgi:tetratricopeptide (TPR) repeat protein